MNNTRMAPQTGSHHLNIYVRGPIYRMLTSLSGYYGLDQEQTIALAITELAEKTNAESQGYSAATFRASQTLDRLRSVSPKTSHGVDSLRRKRPRSLHIKLDRVVYDRLESNAYNQKIDVDTLIERELRASPNLFPGGVDLT